MTNIREQLRFVEDMRHRHVLALERAIFNLPAKVLIAARGSSLSADAYTRAAIEAGWIASPSVEVGEFEKEKRYFIDGVNLEDMPAWAVRYVGAQVLDRYEALTAVPKN